MNKQTFKIPEGCKAISMEIIDNAIVTTFEPEKVEFKKGDFVFAEWLDEFSCIAIYSHADKYHHNFICKLYKDGFFEKMSNQKKISIRYTPRIATNTETQLLFDALAKENKAWDAEKMEIVELKYIPKVGDCVKLDTGKLIIYFCVKDETDKYVNSKYMIKGDSIENDIDYDIDYDKCGGYIKNSYDRIYTKITPEELQAEFNKLGYEYDFNTHEAKKLRWIPKNGERYWFLVNSCFDVFEQEFNEDYTVDLRRYKFGNCFKTEAEAQKFKDYILKYEPQTNN